MLKVYLKALLYLFIIIIGLTLFVTIFEYFSFLGPKIINILKLSIPLIALGTGSFIVAKNSEKKGYQKGLIMALIYTLLTIIFSLVVKENIFNYKFILYFAIIVITGTLGGMLGITIKKKS